VFEVSSSDSLLALICLLLLKRLACLTSNSFPISLEPP
jgi:hypothetical protein